MTNQYPSRQQAAIALIEAFRLSRIPATIVDRDVTRAGYVIVQGRSVDGYSFQRSVPMMGVVPIQSGIGVLLGRDHKRRMVVVGPDLDQQLAQGIDPAVNNPADRLYYGATNQDNLHTLYCAALSTETDPSMEVVIYPWMWRDVDGEWFELPEQRFDFTSLVPAANTHCLVALWVTAENNVSYTASTPQALVDELDITDVNECETVDTLNYASSIRFWRVYGGMTKVVELDSWRDGRIVINVGRGGNGGLSFDDGTTTVDNVILVTLNPDHFSISGADGEVIIDINDLFLHDDYAFHSNESGEFLSLTEKMTLASDDLFLIQDSAAGYVNKKVKASTLPGAGSGTPTTVQAEILLGEDTLGSAAASIDIDLTTDARYTDCKDLKIRALLRVTTTGTGGFGYVSLRPNGAANNTGILTQRGVFDSATVTVDQFTFVAEVSSGDSPSNAFSLVEITIPDFNNGSLLKLARVDVVTRHASGTGSLKIRRSSYAIDLGITAAITDLTFIATDSAGADLDTLETGSAVRITSTYEVQLLAS